VAAAPHATVRFNVAPWSQVSLTGKAYVATGPGGISWADPARSRMPVAVGTVEQ
jgi:hypothetical protein